MRRLALALEAANESVRALAVWLEIQALAPRGPRSAGAGRAAVVARDREVAIRVISRVLVFAYFLEAGLALLVVPWTVFWERNYFIEGTLLGALLGEPCRPRGDFRHRGDLPRRRGGRTVGPAVLEALRRADPAPSVRTSPSAPPAALEGARDR